MEHVCANNRKYVRFCSVSLTQWTHILLNSQHEHWNFATPSILCFINPILLLFPTELPGQEFRMQYSMELKWTGFGITMTRRSESPSMTSSLPLRADLNSPSVRPTTPGSDWWTFLATETSGIHPHTNILAKSRVAIKRPGLTVRESRFTLSTWVMEGRMEGSCQWDPLGRWPVCLEKTSTTQRWNLSPKVEIHLDRVKSTFFLSGISIIDSLNSKPV